MLPSTNLGKLNFSNNLSRHFIASLSWSFASYILLTLGYFKFDLIFYKDCDL